ncbi:unnamed protein product [Symbiodinium necroappetens]|uniref:Uncharacterized protein n=1 Tax=Symbiodinium necroappetens TaxID=1628268 RepID=A0A812JC45_9DINO|nr:unnamed protein product [Symbiodinium necroappetens]
MFLDLEGAESCWERFLSARRKPGDLAVLGDLNENPSGLPRRRVSQFSAEMCGHSVREVLSLSPPPAARSDARHAASLSPVLGFGERSLSPRLRRGGTESDSQLAADDAGMPRRRLSEFSARMQSGSAVREALSHSPARKFLRGCRGERRFKHSLAPASARESVLSGYGERQESARRLLQVRGESKDFADRGRSSSGIPWRQLPLYDCHGLLLQTGSSIKPDLALRAPSVFSERLHSSDAVKDLLSGEHCRGRMSLQNWQREESRQSLHRRDIAPALTAASRASGHAMETERSRCLAKFDRLCAQTPRAGRAGPRPDAVATAEDVRHLHGKNRSGQEQPSQCIQAPSASPRSMPSPAVPADPEPLRCTQPQSRSRRTYAFEADMAKISLAAGRLATAACSASTATPRGARFLGFIPRQREKVRREPEVLCDTSLGSPAHMNQNSQDITSLAADKVTVNESLKPFDDKVGQVVEFIDKIIGHGRGQPPSQPESEGQLTPTPDKKQDCSLLRQHAKRDKAPPEPEPEVDVGAHAKDVALYPRLLTSALEAEKASTATALRQKDQTVQKERDIVPDKARSNKTASSQTRKKQAKFTALMQPDLGKLRDRRKAAEGLVDFAALLAADVHSRASETGALRAEAKHDCTDFELHKPSRTLIEDGLQEDLQGLWVMLWLQKQMLSFHAMASKAGREHLVPFITVTLIGVKKSSEAPIASWGEVITEQPRKSIRMQGSESAKKARSDVAKK